MVKIMSDTGSMFTPDSGREAGIIIVPLNITVAGSTYKEQVEITSARLLELIREGNVPTSSQPSPGDLIEAYSEASESRPIINISMADGLSGTYSTACAVRDTMPNKEYITVVDSKTLCGPQGALVRKAHKLAEKGLSVREILDRIQENIDSSKSFLIPQDFDYLKRGGRLSAGAAHVGALLRLTPLIVQSEDGKRLDKAAICRGFSKAVDKCIEGFKRVGVDERYIISISHADALEHGRLAYSKVSDAFRGAALELEELTPAFVTQGGPQCVSIQAILRN